MNKYYTGLRSLQFLLSNIIYSQLLFKKEKEKKETKREHALA